jgi:hypothetical protein
VIIATVQKLICSKPPALERFELSIGESNVQAPNHLSYGGDFTAVKQSHFLLHLIFTSTSTIFWERSWLEKLIYVDVELFTSEIFETIIIPIRNSLQLERNFTRDTIRLRH